MAETKNYPVKLFFPFFNWLCFVWFYKLSVEYLDKDGIERILKWLSYSVLGVVLYSVLQVFGLDQFYTGFLGKDELVGTIGNPSHLAGYLALCSPLFFEKKRQNILTLILIWLVILMTKSASGVIVGLAISLFWMFYKRYFKGLIVTIIMVTFGLILIHRQIPYFLTFSHRLEIWGLIWEKAKLRVITGSGLGMMNIWKMTTASDPNSVWRHAHLEYLQVIVESGLIGLILIGWCIKDYFSRFRYCYSELALKLKSIFFGFCLLSLFSFPAHLWLLSSLCMISYSFMYALEGSDGDNQL